MVTVTHSSEQVEAAIGSCMAVDDLVLEVTYGIPSAVLISRGSHELTQIQRGGDTDLTSFSRNIKIFAALFQNHHNSYFPRSEV